MSNGAVISFDIPDAELGKFIEEFLPAASRTNAHTYLQGLRYFLKQAIDRGLSEADAHAVFSREVQLVLRGEPLEQRQFYAETRDSTLARETLGKWEEAQKLAAQREQAEYEREAELKGIMLEGEQQARWQKVASQQAREQQQWQGLASMMRPEEQQIPELPDINKFLYPFTEKFGIPAQREYVESQLPGLMERFQTEQPDARQLWWQSLFVQPGASRAEQAQQNLDYWQAIQGTAEGDPLENAIRGYMARMGYTDWETQQALAGQSPYLPSTENLIPKMTQMEYARYIAPEYIIQSQKELAEAQTEEQQKYEEWVRLGMPAEEPRVKARDPLEVYLEEHPWIGEFYKLSPRQRGFYPSRYTPPAVWRV